MEEDSNQAFPETVAEVLAKFGESIRACPDIKPHEAEQLIGLFEDAKIPKVEEIDDIF